MPTSILLMADTHVPKRARDLPPELWRAVDRADVVVHAGDWVEAHLLDRLRERAAVLHGVYGNNDDAVLRAALPEVARWELEGLRFGAIHETGSAAGREARMDAALPGLDVLVFGHSHIPWDTVTPAGMRLLNPGSPTDRRRQPHCTYLWLVADAGELPEVRFVELPPR